MNNLKIRSVLIWTIVVFILFSAFNSMRGKPKVAVLPYSEFVTLVNNDKVDRVEIVDNLITGMYKKAKPESMADKALAAASSVASSLTLVSTKEAGADFQTVAPNDPQLTQRLLDKSVQVNVKPQEQSLLWTILVIFGPTMLFLVVYFVIMKKMSGGGKGGPFSFGKSKAKLIRPEENKVTWDDVKGVDEAKQDLQEIVDFLKHPAKFRDLGGKIPKGVLLSGSPGCGKTHLSRALAHEAGANFFTLSGSDFVEMFVGVGASRVRDLFEQARKNAPSIIFIDEIDAVGRQRGAGIGGGNDEREQTLNALLVEMDGFDQTGGVIVIAATNRPDVLDSALLRPGRFDRQVVVSMPDIVGRTEILEVYVKNVPLSPDVKVEVLARGTPGFSGADLANLVNEAALFAARGNKKVVEMSDFEAAKDKILMGAERRNMMTEEEKKNTAYHEAGHAITNLAMEGMDPVHKVTIVPRGRALGVTMTMPERDTYAHDREGLKKRMVMMLGGRLAEELFLGQMSTGASDDIRRVTGLAKQMVTDLGMSNLGPVRYSSDDDGSVFLGRSMAQGNASGWSEETQRQIDKEVRDLVTIAYVTARDILRAHQNEMHKMAEMLLEKESIGTEECKEIMGERLGQWKIASTPMSGLN